jgi:hypothetical protein
VDVAYLVGHRLANYPSFERAFRALTGTAMGAADHAYDRGHKAGAQRGAEYEYKRLVDYYTAAGVHNGLTEVEQKALEEFQATPAASTAEGWEKFLRGLGVPLVLSRNPGAPSWCLGVAPNLGVR